MKDKNLGEPKKMQVQKSAPTPSQALPPPTVLAVHPNPRPVSVFLFKEKAY